MNDPTAIYSLFPSKKYKKRLEMLSLFLISPENLYVLFPIRVYKPVLSDLEHLYGFMEVLGCIIKVPCVRSKLLDGA